MKRIFTLLASAFLFTMVMGQPSALIKKATEAPVIDGVVDNVWAEAEENAINQPFSVLGVAETPTVGSSWWKMLWNEDGLFILVYVEDDVFVPAYMSNPASTNNWMFDKPEIYFDCNYTKPDDLGPGTAGTGHYQVAPTEIEALVNGGTATTDATNGYVWAFNATDAPHYYVEYFVPFTMLKDKLGAIVDVTEAIGFDVNIMDNDILTESRNRMNWANAGAINETYSNMNDAGLIILDGAVAPTQIETINIAGGVITTDNGTFQITSEITPADATIKQLNYVVTTGGTGKASVSATGLVTGIVNGTVTFRAVASDGSGVESNEVTVTVSNQIVKIDEINMIKNGNFTLGADGKESWNGIGVVESEESWYNIACVPKVADPLAVPPVVPQIWDNMFGQGVKVDGTTKYFVKFKAKASTDMTIPTFFEDRGTGYDNNKVETSSSPYRTDANWMIPVTTEAKWYEFDVTFSNFREFSAYELNFQLGMNDGTFSLDSIQMVSEAELALLILSNKTIAANQLSVYPNPAVDELTVNMTSINAKVAIYNSLGQKMMEKVSTGTVAKFNVSSLRKGLYFLKLEDGTTQKFIK